MVFSLVLHIFLFFPTILSVNKQYTKKKQFLILLKKLAILKKIKIKKY